MTPSVKIILSGFDAAKLRPLRAAMESRADLHNRIATDAEIFVKEAGSATAATEHKISNRLGATPTGHLQDAYEQIQHQSTADEATLLVPRASRLRAAFGAYVLTPGQNRQFLTIPACAEAYGHRAGEFADLFCVRVGPQKTPVLARSTGPGRIQTMYVFVKQTSIPEDAGLIPFAGIQTKATESAGAFVDEAISAALSS